MATLADYSEDLVEYIESWLRSGNSQPGLWFVSLPKSNLLSFGQRLTPPKNSSQSFHNFL